MRITGDGSLRGGGYPAATGSEDVHADRLFVRLDATFSGELLFDGAQVQLSAGALEFYDEAVQLLTVRQWTSADTDVDGLISGTTAGAFIEGRPGGHLTFGIRDNDAGDGVQIVSGGGNWSTDETYDTLIAFFRADGAVFFSNTGTTGSLANAHLVTSGGQLLRSTSSLRYKRDIQPYADTEWIFELEPVTFIHTGDLQEYAGLIAEDVVRLEPLAAVRARDGKVDNYNDRVVMAALIREVQNMRHDVDYINERLGYDARTGR